VLEIPAGDLHYAISLEEIGWGLLLIAITMTLHGLGMLLATQAGGGVSHRLQRYESYFVGVFPIVVASWIIVIVHLMEAIVWAGFFLWKGAMPSTSVAYYFTVMEYTTVGSQYNLPLQWRLLEGMVAMAGLLCFAWSTGVLFTLAQEFQQKQIAARLRRAGRGNSRSGQTRPS
jgi:hypothetical protein